MQWPRGVARDSKGNAWIASFFNNTVVEISPDGKVLRTVQFPIPGTVWGIAVDGSDRVWVAGFADPTVSPLCGENSAACPPGSAPGDLLTPQDGFRSRAIQHLTSLQVDASGNVWLRNNWSHEPSLSSTLWYCSRYSCFVFRRSSLVNRRFFSNS